jgi:hypothetical protein
MKKIIFALLLISGLTSCEKEYVDPKPEYYGGSQGRGLDHYNYPDTTQHPRPR